ncbi:hypothetical protein TL18_06990 [Methanobrevibacter sp. YE315]|uniref:hypothetical protein n=1 Tax=Methanobrevibacter sp. YE315 TaxID=1609968 RepID=UPI000764F0B2|nr:hypothetical protein [Methanobrevibacter sp. YE315]AMD17783.1 hypothetical protein TL18_06990 [Methanobrevibacter sp. YE315]
MKKTLISSYDEINDIFKGKVENENGISADFSIADGIFLGIDKNHFPNSIYVNEASKVFDIPKEILENSNVKIFIDCDSIFLDFNMFIEDLKIFSVKCKNRFGIPNINFVIDSNY